MLLAPGISIHSQRFLQMLLDAGYTVTLVDNYNPKPEGAKRYTSIPYPGMFGLERMGLRSVNRLGQWLEAAQLRMIWQRLQPDIVHVHWVDVRADHCVRARLRPLILTCLGSDINNLFAPENSGEREYRRRIARALATADYVTADSSEVLGRCKLLAERKIAASLFYFGIDLEVFKPGYTQEALRLREKLGISLASKVILSIRSLRPLMGHHYVVEAFSRIADDPRLCGTTLTFLRYLPYADGYEGELRARILELGLQGRVIWLNEVPQEQMPVLYAMANVVVNYPERDGFPVTFFEAAACKRPVVSSHLPAYEGVFGPDVFWTVPPKDPVALAEALKTCLTEEPEKREHRLEQAFAAAQDRGDQRKCFVAIESVYRSLAVGRGMKWHI